jgi:hypothetical protein
LGLLAWPFSICQSAFCSESEYRQQNSLPSLVKIANALHTSVDKLLSDSVQDSKSHLMADVQTTFAGCDPDEIYVMPEAANAVKRSIRVQKLKRFE